METSTTSLQFLRAQEITWVDEADTTMGDKTLTSTAQNNNNAGKRSPDYDYRMFSWSQIRAREDDFRRPPPGDLISHVVLPLFTIIHLPNLTSSQ